MHCVYVATLRLQIVRSNALWRFSNIKKGREIKWLSKSFRYFQWLTRYRTVTLLTYPRRRVAVPEGGRLSVALGGIMLRTVLVSAVGAASVLALSCFPASADEAADVQALE